MLRAYEILELPRTAERTLTLPFELRQRSRVRAELDDGTAVGLVLPRGRILRGGDCVLAEDGTVIEVAAAPEELSTVHSDDLRALARASYHLGNRHVALAVGDGWLHYQHDHVLDDMVRGLGLEVRCEALPFEPEAGAYSSGHSHGHQHDHTHGHEHHEQQSGS